MAIFRRKPPNWGKNRDFRPIFGFGIDDLDRRVLSTFGQWSNVVALSGGICLPRETDDEAPHISEYYL